MRVFIINDRVILNIVNSLTLDEKIKDVLKDIILKYDYSYINYIYSVFSVYTTYYASIVDENSHLNLSQVNDILNEFSIHNLEVDRKNVFIADVYDIMYSTSTFETDKFKHFFYDDMFSRLANIVSEENVSIYMEDIFEALITVFGSVEETIVFGLVQSEDLTSNVTLYTEINNNCLMIYIL